ncbi:MAG: flagellar biosynthesis protein FlhB [Alphaproteobacteria bacterium]|nr:flagellar biosynthesis protein FlhB [Alphaproteobacteria bacterium]
MSDENDDAQKTEEPTPKKIEESRKKGQVAMSREVNSWVMLFAGTLVVAMLAPHVFSEMGVLLRTYLEQVHVFPTGVGGFSFYFGQGMTESMKIWAFPILLLVLAAFFAPFAQVGPLFAPEAVKPDISKISPIKGFKRLFSLRSLMEFAKGIFKIGIVAVVSVVILYPYFDKFEHMIGLPMPSLLFELQTLIIRLMLGVLIVMVVVAVADLSFQRAEHTKKLRMTKQEIKDEFKQTEGDPHVKAKLRQLRAERARQRMMQAVPSADVVITNPTHYSIALKYDPQLMEAPLCVAKGIDDVALRIREVAKEHDIELYENRPLARTLFDTVEVDESIPPEHYKAVAEVISYVFKLKGKLN